MFQECQRETRENTSGINTGQLPTIMTRSLMHQDRYKNKEDLDFEAKKNLVGDVRKKLVILKNELLTEAENSNVSCSDPDSTLVSLKTETVILYHALSSVPYRLEKGDVIGNSLLNSISQEEFRANEMILQDLHVSNTSQSPFSFLNLKISANNLSAPNNATILNDIREVLNYILEANVQNFSTETKDELLALIQDLSLNQQINLEDYPNVDAQNVIINNLLNFCVLSKQGTSIKLT